MSKNIWSRRRFMQMGTAAVAAGAAAKVTLLQPTPLWGYGRAVGASDTVRFASIGTGVRGCELLAATLRVPGVECVAACDLYDSRHLAAQEAVQKQFRPRVTTKRFLTAKTLTRSRISL